METPSLASAEGSPVLAEALHRYSGCAQTTGAPADGERSWVTSIVR